MPRLPFFPAAFSLLLLSCGEPMSDEKGPLNLSKSQYWEDPLAHTGSIGMDRLSNEIEGMVVDAPRTIFLDERQTIPLVCLRTQSKEKAMRVSLASTTQLVVSHLETGSVRVVKLARSPDFRDTRAPSKGWINEWHVADIRSIADLGPALGKYRTWLVCGAEASNQVDFQLYPTKGAEKNKEVKDRLRAMNHSMADVQQVGKPPQVSLTEAFASDRSEDWIWRAGEIPGAEKEVRLFLDFKVAGLPGYVFARDHRKTDQSGKTIFAEIPFVILGFDRNHGLIYQAGFHIPVVNPPEGDPDHPVLGGSITMSLKQGQQVNELKRLSSLWAIAGSERAVVRIQTR